MALEDTFYYALACPWPVFFLGVGVMYVLVALVFVAVQSVDSSGFSPIPHSFAKLVLINLNVLTGLGLGEYSVSTVYMDIVLCIESLTRVLILSITTGLVFGRFAKPKSRIAASSVAVFGTHRIVARRIRRRTVIQSDNEEERALESSEGGGEKSGLSPPTLSVSQDPSTSSTPTTQTTNLGTNTTGLRSRSPGGLFRSFVPFASVDYGQDLERVVMVRVVNLRKSNWLQNAQFVMVFSITVPDPSAVGSTWRSQNVLSLARSYLPQFSLPLTLRHVVDEDSPIAQYSPAQMLAGHAQITVSITATDPTQNASVSSVHVINAYRFAYGAKFQDMFEPHPHDPNKRLVLLHNLSEVKYPSSSDAV